ncbi:MAG: hypothetical protein ABI091_14190 [Ferruginibacter sp.]
MKRLTALAIFITFSSCVFSQENQHSISLIPTPVSMQAGAGSFILNKSASIELSAEGKDAERVADFLSKKYQLPQGIPYP